MIAKPSDMDYVNYRIPLLIEFVDGFEYERTDGSEWYKKTYRRVVTTDNVVHEFQRNDVKILIPQKRVRVPKNINI